MSYATKFTIEVVVVAVVFATLVMVVHGVGEMAILKNGTPTTHAGYMTRLAVLSFIAGGAGHVVFELLGANAWYCRHGAACGK